MANSDIKLDYEKFQEPKRNTVLVGERIGRLLSRLREVNGDARCTLNTLAGSSNSANGVAGQPKPPTEGFFPELLEAIGQMESEVDELESTLRRLIEL